MLEAKFENWNALLNVCQQLVNKARQQLVKIMTAASKACQQLVWNALLKALSIKRPREQPKGSPWMRPCKESRLHDCPRYVLQVCACMCCEIKIGGVPAQESPEERARMDGERRWFYSVQSTTNILVKPTRTSRFSYVEASSLPILLSRGLESEVMKKDLKRHFQLVSVTFSHSL